MKNNSNASVGTKSISTLYQGIDTVNALKDVGKVKFSP
jgi:hypothetical protein